MSESEEHRTLVLNVKELLSALYPGESPIIDIQRAPGYPVPSKIGAFRPDVFIRSERAMVIAEAKTDKDLGRRHTYDQVASFITYLERSAGGLFVLSVTGRQADFAKTVLRFAYRDFTPSRTTLAVFDGYDMWSLLPDGSMWKLWDINRAGASTP